MKDYDLAARGIDKQKIRIEALNALHKLDDFDCDDKDINEFLKEDALIGLDAWTNNTHIFIYEDKLIGFITTCCDSIKLTLDEKNNHEKIKTKEYKEFPAVKIARLGVDKRFNCKGIGTLILNWGIGFALNEIKPKVACRFITVDAYTNKVEWYERRGFVKNSHKEYNGRNTVSMRMDLFNPKKETSEEQLNPKQEHLVVKKE